MRTVTAKQMQQIDRDAVKKLGIPSIVLMENAGRGAAEEIIKDLKKRKPIAQAQAKVFGVSSERELKRAKPNIIIICGPGNNGGDGLVVARHLLINGIKPKVFVLVPKSKIKGDAAINLKIFQKMKGCVKFSVPLIDELKKTDMVVDAMFGIGLSREIAGKFKEVIEAINQYAKNIVALDIPSGLNADTEKIHGACIKATTTVTFHAVKKGMVVKDGIKSCGNIVVCHIGCGCYDHGI